MEFQKCCLKASKRSFYRIFYYVWGNIMADISVISVTVLLRFYFQISIPIANCFLRVKHLNAVLIYFKVCTFDKTKYNVLIFLISNAFIWYNQRIGSLI